MSEPVTAYATLALAIVAAAAIIVPVIQRNRERVLERRAALRQLRLLMAIYERRLHELSEDPNWQVSFLLGGLDVILASTLSGDLARVLPHSNEMQEAYLAIINAHDVLVLVHGLQARGQGGLAVTHARKARDRLRKAEVAVFLERAKYDVKAERLFPHWFKQIPMVSPENLKKHLERYY